MIWGVASECPPISPLAASRKKKGLIVWHGEYLAPLLVWETVTLSIGAPEWIGSRSGDRRFHI